MTEAELVQRLLASKGQDAQVGEALVRSQMDRVYRLCHSLVRNEQAAAELAQEALVRLHTSLPRFRGECAWSSWSYRIARNLCLNWIEKRRELLGEPGLELPDMRPDPVNQRAQAERSERVQLVIERVLDPQEAEAVRLHYSLGMPIAQVTQEMALQTRTGARGLLQRARRKLRRHMLDEMLEDSIVFRNTPAKVQRAMEATLVELTGARALGSGPRELPQEPELRSMTSQREDWLD